MGEFVIFSIIVIVVTVVCHFIFRDSQESKEYSGKEFSVESLRDRSRKGRIEKRKNNEKLFERYLIYINDKIKSSSDVGKEEVMILSQVPLDFNIFILPEEKFEEVVDYYEERGFTVFSYTRDSGNSWFKISWKEESDL